MALTHFGPKTRVSASESPHKFDRVARADVRAKGVTRSIPACGAWVRGTVHVSVTSSAL